MRQRRTGEEEVSWALGKTGLPQCVVAVVSVPDARTETRRDGFPPATSPRAASGLEGGAGERGAALLLS